MKIAVVTATRGNRPEQLQRAISSVESQEGDWKIEHFVVCDGGGEIEVPDHVGLIVLNERRGPGAARNAALEHILHTNKVFNTHKLFDTRYSYVWCLDDDDWADGMFLMALTETIKDYDVAYGDLTIHNLERAGDEWVPKKGGPQFSKDWGGWGSMKEQPYIPLPSCLFKIKFFEEHGLFREDIGRCVDWELLARGEANGAQFIHLNKIVGFAEWRWGEGTDNISTVQPEANFPPTSWARIKTIISGHYI